VLPPRSPPRRPISPSSPPLLALRALARLEADAGWLLEHGVLEAGKARAIRKQVDALCRELRPAALGLMEAFAIPDEVLAAPIAT